MNALYLGDIHLIGSVFKSFPMKTRPSMRHIWFILVDSWRIAVPNVYDITSYKLDEWQSTENNTEKIMPRNHYCGWWYSPVKLNTIPSEIGSPAILSRSSSQIFEMVVCNAQWQYIFTIHNIGKGRAAGFAVSILTLWPVVSSPHHVTGAWPNLLNLSI